MINSLKVSKDSKKQKHKVQYELDSSSNNAPSSYFTQHSKPNIKIVVKNLPITFSLLPTLIPTFSQI